MTDERGDTGHETALRPGDGEPYDDITLVVIHKVLDAMDREDREETDAHERGEDTRAEERGEDDTPDFFVGDGWLSPDVLMVGILLRDFAKAYIDALSKRAADRTIEAVEDRVRFRRRRRSGETLAGVDDGSAATVVITEDLPDEARLALLDLDVTAPEFCGKLLRWHEAVGAWRPRSPEPG